ncbi:hypothetical protein KXD93_07080 [Mucilaginibacter sp. BJC16-A38]|uniref:hypothetical protein n=1 Tax=Mucilaginibacter phenanthrenivorans TaxID=1234842 RepID=UPI0021586983|nr:hypothetical protein [Mucilaginibacter phenanthrenivorans]MCR8557397.1 hypothetical protein [Mucilaginibacter phenanthrenivorans]
MKQLLPFIIVIVFFIIIAVLILGLLNYRLRKRIINSGPLDQTSFKFLSQLSTVSSESLKWGLILFFGGLGLMIMQYIPYSAEDSPLPYGVEMIFVAAGFITYYLIIQNKRNKQDN